MGRESSSASRAGAKLGTLRVGRGVARTAKALPATLARRDRMGRRVRGVPRGAGRLGLVRGPAIGHAGPGRDQDRDGIPGAFDVDDNGNLVLDNVDRRRRGRARAAQAGAPGARGASSFAVFSNFHFDLSETLNANAGGVTDAQIDDAMTRAGSFVGLVFQVPDGGVQLDCGALSYCSAGGTGRTAEPHPDGAPFAGGDDHARTDRRLPAAHASRPRPRSAQATRSSSAWATARARTSSPAS